MMNARVTFKPSTLKQEGTVGRVLRYIQDNPNAVRSTNIALLSNIIANNFGMKTNTVKVVLNKMRNNQMIIRYGGKKHARFMINYYQKDIPGYILEKAPQDIQNRVKTMKDNLAENQYIDDAGCIVTKGDKAKEDEPEEKVEEAEKEPETEKQNVVVPVEIKDDAKGLNLTITLNLTINR